VWDPAPLAASLAADVPADADLLRAGVGLAEVGVRSVEDGIDAIVTTVTS
jgi:hypothetical protein